MGLSGVKKWAIIQFFCEVSPFSQTVATNTSLATRKGANTVQRGFKRIIIQLFDSDKRQFWRRTVVDD